MEHAPIPADEGARLEAVHRLGLLDTPPEERFDRITAAALEKLNVPISTVSILDRDREYYKSCQGTMVKQGDRDISFCGHAMMAKYLFVVPDTLEDPRFADNPMVVGDPHIRFYAGMALCDRKTKQPVGVFCVKDTKPRDLSAEETEALLELAKQAEDEVNAGQ